MDGSKYLSWSSYSGMDGLETDSCDTVLQWTRLQGTSLLLEGSRDSVEKANDSPKCWRYTAADNQASHDQGFEWLGS